MFGDVNWNLHWDDELFKVNMWWSNNTELETMAIVLLSIQGDKDEEGIN